MTTPRQALHVLVVDDHPIVRTGLRTALRLHFPTVLIEEAGCATEAKVILAARRPDLVLLDVNLPVTNGLDLARQILERDRKARILMVAAEADPWTVNEALRRGALGFLAKTNSGDALPEAVRRVLAGSVFLCPDAQRALQRAERVGCGAAAPPGPAVLTQREREVLRHLAHGENTKTIASLMEVSPKTIETHRSHIMRKLGTNSIAALTRYAIRHSLAHL